jgi:hypothetical protein
LDDKQKPSPYADVAIANVAPMDSSAIQFSRAEKYPDFATLHPGYGCSFRSIHACCTSFLEWRPRRRRGDLFSSRTGSRFSRKCSTARLVAIAGASRTGPFPALISL